MKQATVSKITECASASSAEDQEYAVEMLSITKKFGSLVANRDVNLCIRKGEVHALLGENGAGKSTLMNMLYGLMKPDGGQLKINGTEVKFKSPQDAKNAGIGMVHQHYMLVPTLPALQNIILGDKGKFVLSTNHLAKIKLQLEGLIEKYGLQVRLDVPVWQLSVGEQQRVEILRALYHDSMVLILDEPTAMLAPKEVEQLLPRLRVLAAEGTSIIIISHHLDEVMVFADRISVLRAGEKIATINSSDTSANDLANMMVGNDVELSGSTFAAHASRANEDQEKTEKTPVLIVENLNAKGDHGEQALTDVSFKVSAGEIVAIAGVSGNGQTELEEVLFGLRKATSGSISLLGDDISDLQPGDRAKRGVAYIPSDRYRYGLVRNMAVASNLVMDRFDEHPFGHRWKLSSTAIQKFASKLVEKFAIKVKSLQQEAGTLSGGNAQRVVLARALTRQTVTLIAAQPARGLDVGAVSFVWEKLNAARNDKAAVLLISTELEEIFALADRCYVIYRGKLIGHWYRKDLTKEIIGLAMGGTLCDAKLDEKPKGDRSIGK